SHCLVIKICHGEFCAEGIESLCATPCDGMLVGDADDETLLALEEGRFRPRDHDPVPATIARGALCRDSRLSVCRAIISSSSVGMTKMATRLLVREITVFPPALASGSS